MKEQLDQRAGKIFDNLTKSIPDTSIELNHDNPFELLVATILSAQCTDKRVNAVTQSLFQELQTPQDFLNIEVGELEEKIRPTGFYKNKTESLKSCCLVLIEKHNGQVPDNMDDLVQLPGVGRKTANVILAHVFNKPAIAVDTHVKRVALRLGLTMETNPDKVEQDLCSIFPKDKWTKIGSLLILHGRYTCKAKKPICGNCSLFDICGWEGKL